MSKTSFICFGFFASIIVSACVHNMQPSGNSRTDSHSLNGFVTLADQTSPPKGTAVEVNGVKQAIKPNGKFAISVSNAEIFRVKLSGPGLYDSLHTFSQAELTADDGTLSIPAITLVKEKAGRRLLTFGGDAMMGRRYLEPRWNEEQLIHNATRLKDMKSILSEMRPYFEIADYAAINLETILAKTEPTESAPKSVVFYTHPDIVKALEWMSVDYVSLGNNHTYDYLKSGLETTLRSLEKSNLGFSGAGLNEADALKPHIADLDGMLVSAWGYVGWEGRVTPNQVAGPTKGGAAYGSEENIINSLEAGVKPNQIDVVQYHGSREYSEGPSQSTETRLKLAVDHGADLVIAHHPHVTQGFELYKGKLIAYSLGNFAFDQFFNSTHAAAAVNVWMDGDDFYRAEIIPLHVKGYKPLPATNGTRRYILDRITRLSGNRNTIVSRSGGHAVIDNQQAKPAIKPSGNSDILFVGDFESYSNFDTSERTWAAENATFEPTKDARTGYYALEVTPVNADQPATFGLKTFMRVYPADKMRWQGYVKASEGTSITASIQYRPKGMNRYEALKNAPLQTLGSFEATGDGWIPIHFDFDAPSWKNDASRILFKIENSKRSVKLDDITISPVGTSHQGIEG
ncbi:MAG: CapA family protein [Hellea sp.]